MKKILIFLIVPVLALTGCSKNISRLLIDPKNSSTVPSAALFTEAEFNLASTVSSSNVNLNIFRLICQYWTETTYFDEANYDLGTRLIPDVWWKRIQSPRSPPRQRAPKPETPDDAAPPRVASPRETKPRQPLRPAVHLGRVKVPDDA